MLLITSELILIQIGVVLEVIAYLRFRDTKPAIYEGHIEEQPEEVRLTPVKNPAFKETSTTAHPVTARRPTGRDYYKIQDFSVGTRPAELTRTAKVFYFQSSADPVPKAHERSFWDREYRP